MFSLLYSPALTIPSCTPANTTETPGRHEDDDQGQALVSSPLSLHCKGRYPIHHADIFIYGAGGLEELEFHTRTERPDTLELLLREGDKKAVAIANCPYLFNTEAMTRYDAMELVSTYFQDDNPEAPIMSGTCEFSASDDCIMELTPLLCRIILAEVTNNMDDYRRLEEPKVWLSHMNASAALLRADGFRMTEQVQDTLKVDLPCDIGLYTQYPGTTLCCYPNDGHSPTAGNPATEFIFECSIDGVPQVCRTDLPPIKRNATVMLSLTVDAPGIYCFEII